MIEQSVPQPMAYRCVKAAAVGTGLGLAWLGFGYLISKGTVCFRGQFGCVATLLIGVPVFLVLALFSAWPLLRLVKVDRPGQTALVAPVAMWALMEVLGLVGFTSITGSYSLVIVVAAGGYAVAAFVTAKGLESRWQITAGVSVAVLIPLTWLVDFLRYG